MAMGRKPLPANLKLLKASQRARAVNPREPRVAPVEPDVPIELTDDPIARAEWQRVIAVMSPGHIQATERGVLVAYCQKWGEYQTLQTLADNEPAIVRSAHGSPIANPLRALRDHALVVWLRIANELALTPATRSRVSVRPDDDDDNEFTKYQRKR